MSRKLWVAQAVAAGLLAGGVACVTVSPAWADASVAAAVSTGQSTDQSADPAALAKAAAAEEARSYVQRLAKSRLPAEIRTSAWNVLRNSRGDEAIAEWLAPGGGYDYAKKRLRDTRARNKAFCERVVQTHTVGFSPEVRAAAARALKGTDADRAAFVKTGYDQARQRDRVAREANEQHKLEVVAADREFVRALAENDPGAQVRVAAQWALRSGATDADVAEFFGYGWVTGATLDLEEHRLRTADAERGRHHALSRLIEQAETAEAAVQGSADAAEARAEAERAWQAVAEHAGAAQKAWQAEQATAMAQAENWKKVAQLAKDAADGIWKNIADPADATEESWAKEQADAVETATFWRDMYDRAQAAESRLKG
ncbi:ALF repeat-containing protein [Streptomyces sp. NPDC090442]|uniref:ALF repeat-containing protein n=1 Tax=Streptomyces sp. NPDC090442 TaxID=3365962 RepID=UPI003815136C